MDHSYSFPVGAAAVDQGLEFRALSVQVDNNTNQWLYLAELAIYISPYTITAIYPVNGSTKAKFSFTPKPGTQLAAVIPGEAATISYFDFAQSSSAGQTTVVRSPSTEWRNPLSFELRAGGTIIGGGGGTSTTYTVPAGRRARVDVLQLLTEITVSDGSGAGTLIKCEAVFAPGGGAAGTMMQAAINNGTVVGARADTIASNVKELQATDAVTLQAANARGPGVSMFWSAQMCITEGDA